MDKMDQIGSSKFQERIEGVESNRTSNSPPSQVKKRTPMKQFWSGTFWINKIQSLDSLEFIKNHKEFSKAIFGEEVCPKEGTLHYQTFIAFNKRVRIDFIWNNLKKKFPNESGFGWLEPSYSSEEQNEGYCSKDKKFIKWGIFENDYKMSRSDLRSDQLVIADMFKEDEDPKFGRKIYWFWEETGGWGKSALATYMIDNMGATEVSGAKKDILFGVQKLVEAGKPPKIVIVDIPRVNNDAVSIQGIEMVKNGKFFNEKYESGMCRFPRPHIVVFANCEPDVSKMSKDRWIVTNLREGENKYTLNNTKIGKMLS